MEVNQGHHGAAGSRTLNMSQLDLAFIDDEDDGGGEKDQLEEGFFRSACCGTTNSSGSSRVSVASSDFDVKVSVSSAGSSDLTSAAEKLGGQQGRGDIFKDTLRRASQPFHNFFVSLQGKHPDKDDGFPGAAPDPREMGAQASLQPPCQQKPAAVPLRQLAVIRSSLAKCNGVQLDDHHHSASLLSLAQAGMPQVPGMIHKPGHKVVVPPAAISLTTSCTPQQPLKKIQIQILDPTRQKEFSGMRPQKIREESHILHNLKMREKNNSKHAQRKEEEKKRLQDEFNIASGLLRSRAVFLAPSASAAAAAGGPQSGQASEESSLSGFSVVSENSKVAAADSAAGEDREHGPKTATTIHGGVPPEDGVQAPSAMEQPANKSSEKVVLPQKRILRKLLGTRLTFPAELKAVAETRFTESTFVTDCLEWHNRFREIHSAPPLQLDIVLCATSQHWANLLAQREEFFYQNPENLGENLFAWPMPTQSFGPQYFSADGRSAGGPAVTGQDVAVYWYRTGLDYCYAKDPSVLHAQAAQFTQMVWAGSKAFGCGKARSRRGKVIVVANYSPRGNVPGLFHINVNPPNPKGTEESNEEADGV